MITDTERVLAVMMHRNPEEIVKEPESTLKVDEWGMQVTLNTFHYLAARLEYCQSMSDDFDHFNDTRSDWEHWGITIAAWLESLGIDQTSGDNTYNSENALSDDFQYSTFEYEDETYVILQVHLGGDIRGNYSRPAVFQFTDQDYFYDWSRVSMSAGDVWFDSDDAGYHWYDDSGHEIEFARAPLSELYDVDVDRAPEEITRYIRMMQDAGRDPDKQLAMGRERVAKALEDAIAKSADIPDVIFYDDEGNGYFGGKKLEPGGTSF